MDLSRFTLDDEEVEGGGGGGVVGVANGILKTKPVLPPAAGRAILFDESSIVVCALRFLVSSSFSIFLPG